MKKVFDVVVTLGALAVGIVFFVLDGAPILKIVAVCNLLIFLFRLIAMFRGNKAGKQVSGRTDSVGQLLASHSERLADWCDYRLHKTRITAYLTAIGVTALLTVIGFAGGRKGVGIYRGAEGKRPFALRCCGKPLLGGIC